MRGDSGVAGEGRVAGIPKFHSWGKYTMPLTNRFLLGTGRMPHPVGGAMGVAFTLS